MVASAFTCQIILWHGMALQTFKIIFKIAFIGGGVHTHTWRSEDSLRELGLSLHHVDPADQIQVTRVTKERAQQLRILAVLAKDTGSVISTHMPVRNSP